MRVFLGFILSFLLHAGVLQWHWHEENTPVDGSAGQMALAIQSMRFVQREEDTELMQLQAEKESVSSPQSEPLIEAPPEEVEPKQSTSGLAASVPVKDVEEPNKTTDVELLPVPFTETEPEPRVEEAKVAELKSPPPAALKEQELPEVNPTEDQKPSEQGQQGLNQLPVMAEPRYRKAFAPDYPRLARQRGQAGLVVVRARVGVDGFVDQVKVLSSSGFDVLDQRALSTVERWEFYPHQLGEQLSVAWVDVPVEFTLGR